MIKELLTAIELQSPILSDLLEIKFIQTMWKFSDYEEGICKAAKPLLQSGIIQNQYLENLLMIIIKG
mgnify:CR=1 FL=1